MRALSEVRNGAEFAAPRPYDGPNDEGDSADDAELPLEADRSPSPAAMPVPASRTPHRRYLDGRHLKQGILRLEWLPRFSSLHRHRELGFR